MAERRLGSVVAIVAIVAALLAVWWIDRGRDHAVHRVDAPVRIAAPPPPELAGIADAGERAEVAAVAAAIDRGGPFAPTDGAVFADRERRLPPRPPGYWRAYAVGARRLVAGPRHELYYSRDHDQSFSALRGALP